MGAGVLYDVGCLAAPGPTWDTIVFPAAMLVMAPANTSARARNAARSLGDIHET